MDTLYRIVRSSLKNLLPIDKIYTYIWITGSLFICLNYYKNKIYSKMNKIPTAEEYLKEKGLTDVMSTSDLIEFAKLHVQQALKEAADKGECYYRCKYPGDEDWVVDIDSILNSYPLTNIK